MKASTCRSCGAPIVWAVTEATGARIPIDAEPAPDGNLRVRPGEPPKAAVVGATIDLLDPEDDGTRYLSHFVTCPNADEHRRR